MLVKWYQLPIVQCLQRGLDTALAQSVGLAVTMSQVEIHDNLMLLAARVSALEDGIGRVLFCVVK